MYRIQLLIKQGGHPRDGIKRVMHFTDERIFEWTLEEIKRRQRNLVFETVVITDFGSAVVYDDSSRVEVTHALDCIFREAWA